MTGVGLTSSNTYGPEDFAADTNVSRETLDKLKNYSSSLVKWQKAKNLVANSTLDDRWRRHFLDSAQLFPLIRQHHPTEDLKILDIGSGAGFPGLVLSIMGLGLATMVEANGRKCTFMKHVARETAAPLMVLDQRIESVEPEQFDIITSRACAKITQLLDWSAPFLAPNSEIWLLKGASAEDELTQATALWNMTVERFDSRTSQEGVILRLSGIKKH